MIYSEVIFDTQAKEKLNEGVALMARAVGSTLGPLGRNVAIAYSTSQGEIYLRRTIHDGVEVSKSISFEDEFVDMGAQLLKQAAQKQVQDVGDGTTVSIILAEAILSEFNTLAAAGVSPMKLRKSVEDAIVVLVSEIKKQSIPVETFAQLKNIATISSQDTQLGELVARTIDDMKDGLVTVEESKSSETVVEKQEGMQIEKGYAHQYFMTNPDRLEANLENPLFLITDKPINSLEPLKSVLEHCFKSGEQIVIITPSMGPEAIAALLDNKIKGTISSLVVLAPSFGQNQKNTLQDLAIFTNSRFITEDAGHKFEDIEIKDLGRATYVTANKTETIIVGGAGKKVSIAERVKEIQAAIAAEETEFDREKMQERLAKLTTGIAVIKVGGVTEVEMKERLERVKDAVAATKAAKKYGVIAGGEVAYLRAREVLDRTDFAQNLLYKALYKPFSKLLNNAGLNDGEWYEKLQHAKPNFGVNVLEEKLVNMISSGIIDPTAVSINALQNASSVAILLATTGTIVVQKADAKNGKM